MNILNSVAIKSIIGGVLPAVEAVLIGVGIFEAPYLIGVAIEQYGPLGSKVGEFTYNTIHPNAVGKMIYTINDFPSL
jgi:hypothetical protein